MNYLQLYKSYKYRRSKASLLLHYNTNIAWQTNRQKWKNLPTKKFPTFVLILFWIKILLKKIFLELNQLDVKLALKYNLRSQKLLIRHTLRRNNYCFYTEAKLSFAPLAIQIWITMEIKRKKFGKSFLSIKTAPKVQTIQKQNAWTTTKSFGKAIQKFSKKSFLRN